MLDVAVDVLGCHVENEDQNFYVLEDVFSLGLEVLLHKHILATAVPE
jgi:hypothetical protein